MPNPTKLLPENDKTLRIAFDNGDEFLVPYFELRFECPCATCVDEITGKRTLKKESLNPNVKPKSIEPVGRYGIKVNWSDGHSTGMFHFDRLYEISVRFSKLA